MKRLVYILAVIMLIGLLPVAACQTDGGETHTPIPVKDMGHLLAEEPAPDDILPAPGGSLYRANIQQEGVENPWPPIEGTEIVLGNGSNAANIVYRDYIETKAGEARNNVIQVKIPSKEVKSLSLYTVAIPYGIFITVDSIWSGIPGTQEAVLVIEIAPDVAPGEYPLEIGLEINGKDYGIVPCNIEVVEPTIEKSTDSGVYHSEEGYLTVSLPEGWAAVEGPEYLAHPYEGQLAFNSWGENDFWAREVPTDNSDNTTSYSYSTQTVMLQIPEGGAYVALVRIWGPPRMPDYAPPEYTLDDLSELYQPHDWRQDDATDAQFIQFYKWGRDLRLEIACRPDTSDKTVAELNDLLESWRFDSVPAGDIEWAGIQARKLLPEEVEPLKFSNRAGRRGDDGVDRVTQTEVSGDTVRIRFMYRWNNPSPGHDFFYECPEDSCHWWEIDVLPTGETVLVDEGGAKLPF